MISNTALTRRALLKGAAGVSIALPFLESWSGGHEGVARGAESTSPLRVIFVYVPNGVHMPDWTPAREGAEFELSPILSPLTKHREKLLVLSGLAVHGADGQGDGPGDHARSCAAFLTCTHPRKTDGADIQAGVSVDQIIAKVLGQGTPLPTIELGTEPSAQNGNCDSGYSCAYSSNLAWHSPSAPLAKEINPRRAFERLFLDAKGLTPAECTARDRNRSSVLDAVKEDAAFTRARLDATDRRKLDEYLDSVRALEKRLAAGDGGRARRLAGHEPPEATPGDYADLIDKQYEVVKLAFETDSTRIVTFMCGNEGSNRSYPMLSIPEGHHNLSHHGNDKKKQEKISQINRFHVERLARFADALASVREAEGTLLDHTLIVFGGGISDGDAHNHDELPILLLGGAGGALASSRHVRYARGTPIADLYLWILRQVGVAGERFADSRGVLGGISK